MCLFHTKKKGEKEAKGDQTPISSSFNLYLQEVLRWKSKCFLLVSHVHKEKETSLRQLQ